MDSDFALVLVIFINFLRHLQFGESAPPLLSRFWCILLAASQRHIQAWYSYCSIWVGFCFYVDTTLFRNCALLIMKNDVLKRQCLHPFYVLYDFIHTGASLFNTQDSDLLSLQLIASDYFLGVGLAN